jgi:crossover junction endodeoxyribonuclease RuvC
MRVLGVDCGSQTTGFGVIESDGFRHRALDFGTVRTLSHGTFAERLHQIHCRITELLLDFTPESVAIEDVFSSQNVRSAFKLAHVRGVVMQAAAAQSLLVAEYAPLKVKSTVTGYGRAEKPQVQHMVAVLLGLGEAPKSLDASDALAVAICHAQHAAGMQRMTARAQAAR